MNHHPMLFVPAFLFCAAPAPILHAAGSHDRYERLLTDVRQGNYARATEFYKDSILKGIHRPQAYGAAGYAWLKQNLPEPAQELLFRAQRAGVPAVAGIPPPEQLLARIKRIEMLLPPLYAIENTPRIEARASGNTLWEKEILGAIPRFPSAAWRILRRDPPPIRILLASDRKIFEELYRLFLGTDPEPAWKSGTGGSHLVLLCGQDRQGAPSGMTPANALHEYGHAVLSTYFGDHYEETVPPWMDEGLASLMAADLDAGILERAGQTLRAAARRGPLPSLDILSSRSFYDSAPDLNYAASVLMMEEVRRMKGKEIFRRILDRSRACGSLSRGFEQAVGLTPQQAYAATLRNHSRR